MNRIKYSALLATVALLSANQADAMLRRSLTHLGGALRISRITPRFRYPIFSSTKHMEGFMDDFGNHITPQEATTYSAQPVQQTTKSNVDSLLRKPVVQAEETRKKQFIKPVTGWFSTKLQVGLQVSKGALQTTYNKGTEVFTASVKPAVESAWDKGRETYLSKLHPELTKAAQQGHNAYKKSVQPKLEKAGTKAWEKCEPYYKQIEPKIQPVQLSLLERMAKASKDCYNFFRRRHYHFNKSAKKTEAKMNKKEVQNEQNTLSEPAIILALPAPEIEASADVTPCDDERTHKGGW